MTDFLREAHDLVLYARAVAGAYSLDFSGIEGRTPYVSANNLVSFFVCISYPAGDLVRHRLLGFKAEGHYMLVAVLNFKLVIINAVFRYAGGSSCFEAAQLYAEAFKALRKGH